MAYKCDGSILPEFLAFPESLAFPNSQILSRFDRRALEARQGECEDHEYDNEMREDKEDEENEDKEDKKDEENEDKEDKEEDGEYFEYDKDMIDFFEMSEMSEKSEMSEMSEMSETSRTPPKTITLSRNPHNKRIEKPYTTIALGDRIDVSYVIKLIYGVTPNMMLYGSFRDKIDYRLIISIYRRLKEISEEDATIFVSAISKGSFKPVITDQLKRNIVYFAETFPVAEIYDPYFHCVDCGSVEFSIDKKYYGLAQLLEKSLCRNCDVFVPVKCGQ